MGWLAVGTIAAVSVLFLIGIGGWPGSVSGCVAAGECSCEAIGNGLVAQPANTISSLVFVLSGLAIAWIGAQRTTAKTPVMKPRAAIVFGAVVVLTGLGSIAFHASMTEWGGWLDLVGAAGLLIFAVVYRAGALSAQRLAVAIGVVAALLWVLGTANGKYLLYGLAAIAAVIEVRGLAHTGIRRDRRWLPAALALFVAGAAVWWYSRTGFALCSAESSWQWHGVWHVLVASALVALFAHWRSEVLGGEIR